MPRNCVICKSKQTTYNFEGLKAEYCGSCKKDNMVNVVSKKCKNDFCSRQGNRSYRGYCTNCFQNQFPTDPLTFQIRCKTKEIAIHYFINSNYEGFINDKALEYRGCNCLIRRKINHRKLINDTLICIETDENSHKSYNNEDKKQRYEDLMMTFTCKYIFIRFNPNNYKSKNNKNVNPMIGTRLRRLKEEIDKQILRIEKNENVELLEVVELYYDGFN